MFNLLLVSEKMVNTLLFFKLLFDYSFVRGTSAAMACLSVKIFNSLFALCSAIFIVHASNEIISLLHFRLIRIGCIIQPQKERCTQSCQRKPLLRLRRAGRARQWRATSSPRSPPSRAPRRRTPSAACASSRRRPGRGWPIWTSGPTSSGETLTNLPL